MRSTQPPAGTAASASANEKGLRECEGLITRKPEASVWTPPVDGPDGCRSWAELVSYGWELRTPLGGSSSKLNRSAGSLSPAPHSTHIERSGDPCTDLNVRRARAIPQQCRHRRWS